MNKKLIIVVSVAVALVIALSITFGVLACAPDKTLDTPTNVSITDEGLITWSAVKNAEGYVVTINGENYETNATSYKVSSVINDFTYSITALAKKGHKNSNPTQEYTFKGKGNPKPEPPANQISVAVNGPDTVYSGSTAKFSAKVTGTVDVSVTWAITQGSEYAEIDKKGNLTAKEVTGDKIIKIEARSKVDKTAFGEKVVSLVAKPELTQDMLDQLNSAFISFSGFISIELYNDSSLSSSSTPEGTYTSVIRTEMNGTYWYSEYENATTGLTTPIYYKKHENKACQVGLSFMNEEEYFPMVDDFGSEVSWEDAGLYNSLCNLKVSDFTFDTTTWRYVYTGNDTTLTERVIASANPYDFKTDSFALTIDEGEISGIYSKSQPDYTIQTGYKAIQYLNVMLTVGEEFVSVPMISKYPHDAEWHPQLTQAIANMQALESYTVDLTDLNQNLMGVGFTQSGFVETITPDLVHYKPFNAVTNTAGEDVRNYTKNGEYGYKTMREGLYNSYFNDGNGTYSAGRAFAGDISSVKPSFAFAAEIFIPMPNEDGSITYFVDDPMCSVASTFFYGVGNDINLYGIFATRGYTSETTSFTPFITVKDGYIVEACFYYNIGSLIYGVISIEYKDFNCASLPAEEVPTFETREIPTSWSQLQMIVTGEGGSTDDDYEVNALEYFKNTLFAGVSDIEEKLPFFGDVLGDAYGFGLTTLFRPTNNPYPYSAVCLYYDVPLDTDYTITSSIEAVKQYLRDEGFTQTSSDTFEKDEIVVVPRDENLDFMIYVYKNPNGNSNSQSKS